MTIDNNKKNMVLGRAALFLMTFLWGTSFVILKDALDSLPTLYVLAYRFTGASILLFLIGLPHIKKFNMEYIKGGAILGVLLFVAYTIQTYGLCYTTPGKNAFLTTTYCVITPFLFWLFAKKKPDKYNIIAAVICFIGVGFVSLKHDFSINKGDLLTLICGLFFALHIVFMGKFVNEKSVALLSSIQFAVAALLAWIFGMFTGPVPTDISSANILRIVYLCVACTALCFFLQAFGQKYTPPSSVAVIMTLESVFGTIISVAMGYEVLNAKLIIGFLLIFFAVLTSETKFSFLHKTEKQNEKKSKTLV